MNSFKILAGSSYLPEREVFNIELEKKFNLEKNYIYKRTGIKKRFYIEQEKIENLTIKATQDLLKNRHVKKDEIGLIISATTTPEHIMPGVSNFVQKKLDLPCCICLDILAGCAGYINAFDIASMYIKSGQVKQAIIIGVDVLSKYTDKQDMSTSIILSDGVGVTLIGACDEDKKYFSNIKCIGTNNDMLTCKVDEKIKMDGTKVYKYATTETVKNINELLEKAGENIENIKYIVPHQSNIKIIRSIAKRLEIDIDKMYINIENVGNTFCASIPIALDEMLKNNLLQKGDKIILVGYGGGINTASILLEV